MNIHTDTKEEAVIDEVLMSSSDRVRRAKYFSWACGALTVLMLALTFLIVLTLAQMGARLRVIAHPIPYLPMKSTEFVTIDPLNVNFPDADLITEAFIREFVINRYSVIPDGSEMTRRFSFGGPIHRFLSPKMYAPYANQKETKKKKKEEAEGATPVDVEIRRVSRIGRNWQVEFDKRSALGGNKVSIDPFVVTLEVKYLPSRVSFDPAALNPIGMTIVRYNDYPMEKQ